MEFNSKKLDAGGINALLKFNTCTPKRIRLAYQITLDRLADESDPIDPHRYFFSLIKRKEIKSPPTAHERLLEHLPEHEQDVVGPLAECDVAQGRTPDYAPPSHPRVREFAGQLAAAAPDSKREADAARSAAMKARLKMIAQGEAEEEIEKARKQFLSCMDKQKLSRLIDRVIAEANDFMKPRFEKNRDRALDDTFFTAAIIAAIRSQEPTPT